MSGKFMSVKKIVVPILSLVIMMSSLAGCSVVKDKELLELLNSGSSITIEVAKPDYNTVVEGQETKFNWTQLDQLNTYNKGFRQGVDELFNINIVTEQGKNGKNGVLFVDAEGNRNGNAVLADALRNKVFATKYWNDTKVKKGLSELAGEIYSDVSDNETYNIVASLNGYYNLLPDRESPNTFNFNESLTREDFYSLVYRSENKVLNSLKSDSNFDLAVGGNTEHTRFAKQVYEYGFLPVENKSLGAKSYQSTISRAEAVYMLVNKHFKQELESVDTKAKAFNDTKNGGDLATKLQFKGKERWQAYTLVFMLKNPDRGMQEELYKAMVVAKNEGLITSDESRWDEPMSKGEAILMVINTHMALNKGLGFASESEYGEMVVEATEEATEVVQVVEEDVNRIASIDPNTSPDKYSPSYKQIRDTVDEMYDYYRGLGKSKEEALELADEDAEAMGTNLDDLNKLSGYNKVGETKPVEVVNEPSKPVAVKPSTSTPSQPSTPKPSKPKENISEHGYAITDIDKDGNGVMDSVEDYRLEVDGTSSLPEGTPNPFDMP